MSQRLTFVSKSLLWSLLLYVVSMAIINWDEVVHGFGKHTAQSVAVYVAQPPHEQPTVIANPPSQVQKNIQATGSLINTAGEILLGIKSAAGILR